MLNYSALNYCRFNYPSLLPVCGCVRARVRAYYWMGYVFVKLCCPLVLSPRVRVIGA